MRIPVLCLGALLGALPCLAGQVAPLGPPKGLKVVFVDVGQGDATILVGPTGKVMLYDGGPTGAGKGVVLNTLRSLGATKIQWLLASHYDLDHIGGLDEVMRTVSVAEVWDRGSRDAPGTFGYRDYVAAAGNRRRTVRLGQVFDLGGGAKATVLCYDGNVLGRSTRLPIKGAYQQENAASLALRVEYGDFSMWLGGDLTGGGNRTYDVESHAARACGDVDVLRANHHGSATSNNTTMLSLLRPELVFASNGTNNPFGHPHTEVINRFNTRAASRCMLNTSAGRFWSGYSQTGTTTLDTDGWRYRVRSANGQSLEFYTDGYLARAPLPGDLVISEVHRNPSTSLGEYIEIYHRGVHPVSLSGLTLRGNLGSLSVATPYRLLPGQRFVLYPNGIPTRNGGLPLGHCWPYRAMTIGNSFDTLRIERSATIDQLTYSSSFAGGRSIAAERVKIHAPTVPSNFRAARTRYSGDYGTPRAINSVDNSTHPLGAGVESLGGRTRGGAALHLFASGFDDARKLTVLGLSGGTSPGLRFGSVTVPLNLDPLLSASFGLPGFIAVLPMDGLHAVRMPIPSAAGGTSVYFAHFRLDPFRSPLVPKTSRAVRVVLPR